MQSWKYFDIIKFPHRNCKLLYMLVTVVACLGERAMKVRKRKEDCSGVFFHLLSVLHAFFHSSFFLCYFTLCDSTKTSDQVLILQHAIIIILIFDSSITFTDANIQHTQVMFYICQFQPKLTGGANFCQTKEVISIPDTYIRVYTPEWAC